MRFPRHNKLLDALEILQIAVGGMHCVALTQYGQIVTWGVNDHGALGRDTVWEAPTKDIDEESGSDEDDSDLNPKECTPTAIASKDWGEGAGLFVQVAATNSASFALTNTGTVFGWGTFSVSVPRLLIQRIYTDSCRETKALWDSPQKVQ